MNKIEYKAMKKLAIAQLGADDAESLIFYAEKLEKQSKLFKWLAILIGVISLPLCLLLIGIPLLIMSIFLYFLGYRKMVKKARMFKDFVYSDTEISAA